MFGPHHAVKVPADAGNSIEPVVEEFRPAPDAWEACRRLARLPGVLFLDSSQHHPEFGRYSFVTADPFAWLRTPYFQKDSRAGGGLSPFRRVAGELSRYQRARLPGLPPFQGGAAGLFGYGLCQYLERLPRPPIDEFRLPDMIVGIYDWVLAFDHRTDQAWCISTGLPAPESRRRERAAQRLAMCRELLKQDSGVAVRMKQKPALLQAAHPVAERAGLLSSMDRTGYLCAARRAIEYIHAGHCFQVNLAHRLVSPLRAPPLDIYQTLRRCNPASHGAYFDAGECIIASASPEQFLRVQGSEIKTRPIKGTRACGATKDDDERVRQALLGSAKDRAENVMIVDLLRNDLGKVCRFGSVEVGAVCGLESYSQVHHLVSDVRGRLRAGLGALDALQAAFPGGSVTGAPKVRAMQVIAELEPTARGPYCGCLGYIGFDGTMDTSILIRTLTLSQGWVQFPVGGGIVADSVPEQEYQETWDKATGLVRALSAVGAD